MDAKDYLQAFYESYDEHARLTTRHGQIEFITTMTYMERYLRPGMRIMEIGAGTGRYSHTLAQRGYSVDAVELLEHNIEQFRSHTQPGEPVTITQGSAVDLSAFADDAYDMTLLLGPMYHLFTEEDKRAALREAVRVTKSGGVILTAYCMSDPSVISYGFLKGNIKMLMEKSMVNPDTFAAYSDPCDLFELHRVEDIEALRSPLPVEPLHLIATDGFANHIREAIAAMDEETYELYIRYHMATCERRDMLGYSHHTLDICRKRG